MHKYIRSFHCLWRSQMLVPPQSVHLLRMRRCSQTPHHRIPCTCSSRCSQKPDPRCAQLGLATRRVASSDGLGTLVADTLVGPGATLHRVAGFGPLLDDDGRLTSSRWVVGAQLPDPRLPLAGGGSPPAVVSGGAVRLAAPPTLRFVECAAVRCGTVGDGGALRWSGSVVSVNGRLRLTGDGRALRADRWSPRHADAQ